MTHAVIDRPVAGHGPARPRRGMLAACVVAMLACTSLAFAAVPARAFEIAVQDDATFLSGNGYPRELAFQQARQIGASTLRVNVFWSDWKRRGAGPYDELVDRARAWRMRVQLTIVGTPSYAPRSANRWLSYNNPSAGRMASFSAELARHFRGRVARYSIWNEPNLSYFLSPQRRAPAIYRNLYRAAYGAIKRADPRAQVLFGELYSGNLRCCGGTAPMTFLNQVGGDLRADGLAYHPFQFGFAPGTRSRRFVALASVSTIRATLRGLARSRRLRTPGGGTLPIYFTEFGYQVIGSWTVRPESRRASWIVAAFRQAKRDGVRSMLYYHLVRSNSRRWDSGIVTAKGTPMASFQALVSARRSLVGY